jgi:biopolymer transport protein TolR
MIMSRRAKRMERQHKRGRRLPGINLVSMMDIFTILVFFLLVNSSDGEVLPAIKSVRLPESVAEAKPRETVVISVSETDVSVQGKVVTGMAQLLMEPAEISPGLKAALEDQSRRAAADTPASTAGGREATIMGDKTIPYRVLKKIMATCTRAGYGRISLAVMQRQPEEG